ncbi:hypothetical protein BJX99DRAFT_225153 [Aspergillus californicus]
MEVQELIRDVQPLVGQVTPIKTVQETRPAEEYDDAYVAAVYVKGAAKVVKALDAAFSRNASRPMNHLRRFAKKENLPEHIRPLLLKDNPSNQTIFVLVAPPLPDVAQLQELLAPFTLIPGSNSNETSSAQDPTEPVKLHTIKVPTLPPISAAQADKWSKELWPVSYNPAAARVTISPNVQVLNRTRDFIQPDAGRYLALARKVAEETEQCGRGRKVGAVVVDPDIVSRLLDTNEDTESRWADAVVAVAGDARYSRREAGNPSIAELHTGAGPNPAAESYNADLEGGPDLHPLMRATAIIAYKRRTGDPEAEADKPDLSPLEAYFLSQTDSTAPDPETNLESESESQDVSPIPEKYQKTGPHEAHAIGHPSSKSAAEDENNPGSRIRPRSQGGYLCTDLDVYLTHEPCVCCCMGLLLSRFRSVTYPQSGRMVTGGLASEPVISPFPVPASNNPELETENVKHENELEHVNDSAGTESAKKERLYYGIHWRKELNWRALGFEFIQDGKGVPRDENQAGWESLAEDEVAFYA